METASLIISIISLTVSAIVTGIPFYRNYIERKTRIALIACNGIIRNDVIRIMVTYVNKNWQNAVITNTHISLSHSKLLNEFTKVNHAHSCKPFNPLAITEKMHASIELEYSLSDLKDADVYVHTEYIDSQGQRLSDSHRVGNLCRSGISTKMVLIESAIYELQGRSILMCNSQDLI